MLLIESDADTRELYAEYLGIEGLTVRTADSTDIGRQTIAGTDVVVTDTRIADTADGLDFVQWLRSDPARERVGVVVLSGCGFPEDEKAAREAGTDIFLTKPCLPEDLLQAIRLVHVVRTMTERREPGTRASLRNTWKFLARTRPLSR